MTWLVIGWFVFLVASIGFGVWREWRTGIRRAYFTHGLTRYVPEHRVGPDRRRA